MRETESSERTRKTPNSQMALARIVKIFLQEAKEVLTEERMKVALRVTLQLRMTRERTVVDLVWVLAAEVLEAEDEEAVLVEGEEEDLVPQEAVVVRETLIEEVVVTDRE